MAHKIISSDIVKYTKKETEEFKSICDKIEQLDLELQSKFNLKIKDLIMSPDKVANEFINMRD